MEELTLSTRVLLFDGCDDDGRFVRADRRYALLQGKGKSKVVQLHDATGRKVGIASDFCDALLEIANYKSSVLMFIHLGAIRIDYLVERMSKWGGEPRSSLCFVFYSGAGVTEEKLRPLRELQERLGISYLGCVGLGIEEPVIRNHLLVLVEKFYECACRLQAEGDERATFIDELGSLMDSINNPLQVQWIALHILLSVYLAARQVDPRGGGRLEYSFLDFQHGVGDVAHDRDVWISVLSPGYEAFCKEMSSQGDPNLTWVARFLEGKREIASDEECVKSWVAVDRRLHLS